MRKVKNRWSTIVPKTDREDRGEIRRCFDGSWNPELGCDGCRTLYEALRHGKSINPLGPCLGFRATSTSGFATPYIYSSYTEIVARVDSVAAGLEALDLVRPNDTNLKLLGLYLPNCMEWVIAEHAIYSIGGATVPFYDTLGPDTVEFILQHTRLSTLVCSRNQLARVCQAAAASRGDDATFHTAILVDGVTAEAAHMAKEAKIQVLSFAKVEAVGAEKIATTGHKHNPPNPDDIATFSYTSGTTGTPKGALLTHANLMTANAGVSVFGNVHARITDRHLSYLPLPHIFERIVMSQMLCSGASVAFFRGDPMYLVEDWQACRPTLMAVAPRVFNRIYDKIYNGINSAGGMKKKLFDAAVSAKTKRLQKDGTLTHAFYDQLIFNKIKAGLGLDHLRLVISGSAPLSDNVMTFFRCMLGIPVVEGYGQTEGAAAATLGHSDDMTTVGHVGGPTGCTEIALYDVPEMGYLHSDTSHRGQPCCGRGEICVRGPNVFKGYYKDEVKTKETIDEEGWLHSGDIGLWRPDGTLQIIDRKKNIFKLSQGEYVAPEKIENVLVRSSYIAQCFVYGDSLQSCVVGLIVPEEEVVQLWWRNNNKNGDASAVPSLETLCQDESLRRIVLDDIRRLSKESQLHGFETVQAILLIPQAFSVENGFMTPTFKLKRQQIRDSYEKEINDLYASLNKSRSKL